MGKGVEEGEMRWRLDQPRMISAGCRGTDCDPEDVAGMVEDYVIDRKEHGSSQQSVGCIDEQHTVNTFPAIFYGSPSNGNKTRNAIFDAWATEKQ